MTEQSNGEQPVMETSDDAEKFLRKSRDEVIATLQELSKKPDLITATFNEGDASESIITTVVAVLPEHGLVTMEYSSDSEKNRRLLAAGSVNCQGKHRDIAIRFRLTELRTARYRGEQLFAAPIPDELWRFQRREFFRIPTPQMHPVTCRVEHAGEPLQLALADISIGGLSLLDAGGKITALKGEQLKDCLLTFPTGGDELRVDLEVRSTHTLPRDKERGIQRIGCAFVGLNQRDITFLQRYVNQLQLQQHKFTRE